MEFGLKNNRINKMFSKLAQQKEKALITYIMAGDPDLTVTGRLVKTLAQAGADLIELGVPFSDPLADGPSIQLAGQRSLAAGTNLEGIFTTVEELRGELEIPIVLMSYYNPLLQFGLETFAARAAKSGIDGLIIPDLPLEESAELARQLEAKGINLIPLIAPTSTEQRMRLVAERDNGFVYCISLTGVTGARQELPSGVYPFLNKVRGIVKQPVAVGFGISNPEQARHISEYADGVIVGSAIVNLIQKYGKQIELLQEEIALFVGNLKKNLKSQTKMK